MNFSLGNLIFPWTIAAAIRHSQRSPSQIAHNVLRKVRAGSIILLHDGDSAGKQNRKNTVQALPLIIKGLEDLDLTIAPISRLLPEIELTPATRGKAHS